ncbi:hypothetical protein [Spirulina major]|uniref:hypothetical protein n=1 Tax=Spirulina major TaxID=270636 RepID=UPI0009340C39|nr:hypothetical protein [Spirulina major]
MAVFQVIAWGLSLLIVAVLAAYCGGFCFELFTGCDRTTKRRVTNQGFFTALLTGLIGGMAGFLWGAYVVDNTANLGITPGSAIALAVQRWMVWGALLGVVYAIARPLLTRTPTQSPSTPTPNGHHKKNLTSGAIVLALFILPPLVLRPVFAQLPPTSSLNMGGQLLPWGIGATALWAYGIVPLLWRGIAPRHGVRPAREWGLIAGLLLGGWITAGGYAIAVLNTEPITVASSTRPGPVVEAIVRPILFAATFLSTASVMSWRIYTADPAQIRTNIRQKIHHLRHGISQSSTNPILMWTGLWSVAALLLSLGSRVQADDLWPVLMGGSIAEGVVWFSVFFVGIGIGFGLLTTTLSHARQGFGFWIIRVWGWCALGVLLAVLWGLLWWWTVRYPSAIPVEWVYLRDPILPAVIQGFAWALLWQSLQPKAPQRLSLRQAGAMRGAIYAATLNLLPLLLVMWYVLDRMTGSGMWSLVNIVLRSVLLAVIVAIAFLVIQNQLTQRGWLTVGGIFLLALALQFSLAQILKIAMVGIGQSSVSLPRLWSQTGELFLMLPLQALQGAMVGGVVGAIAVHPESAATPAPAPKLSTHLPTPPSQDPLAQARAGKPHAIAALLNNTLQTKQITARVTRRAKILQILLEGEQTVPPQDAMVAFLTRGLGKLRSPHLHHIQVAARQAGDQGWRWKTQFTLPQQAGDSR